MDACTALAPYAGADGALDAPFNANLITATTADLAFH